MIQRTPLHEKTVNFCAKPLYLRHKGIPPLRTTVLILYTCLCLADSIALSISQRPPAGKQGFGNLSIFTEN